MQKEKCKNCRSSENPLYEDGYCSVNCRKEFNDKMRVLEIRCQEAFAKETSYTRNLAV